MEDFLGYTIWEEKIERYLLGKMSDSEREAFEKEIASHADLHDKVEFQRKLITAIGRARKDELKKNLREEIAEEKTTFRIPSWTYAVAASAAVLITVGILFYPTFKEKMKMPKEEAKNISENLPTGKSETEKELKDTTTVLFSPPIVMEDKTMETKSEEEISLGEPSTPKEMTIDIMGKQISVVKTDSSTIVTGGASSSSGNASGEFLSETTRSESTGKEKNIEEKPTVETTVQTKESLADTDGDGVKDMEDTGTQGVFVTEEIKDISKDSKLILAMPTKVKSLTDDARKKEEGAENKYLKQDDAKPTSVDMNKRVTTGNLAAFNVLLYTTDKISSDNQIQYKRAGGEIYVYGSEKNLQGKTNVSMIESSDGKYYLKLGSDVYPISLGQKTLKTTEKISDPALLEEISK